jgi:hypothetical protein
MNHELRRQRYTQQADLLVNMNKYWTRLKPDSHGCHIWQGPKHKQNYGMIGAIRIADDKRIMTVAHRVAWRIAHQQAITRDDDVVHTCGNNLCCNPEHLKLKSTQEFIGNDQTTTTAHTV